MQNIQEWHTNVHDKRFGFSFQSSAVSTFLFRTPSEPVKAPTSSMGRGKMMVEFFSAEIEFKVCRYLSWRAAGD